MCGISLRSCRPPLGALAYLELSTFALAAELYEDLKFFTVMAPTLTDLRNERIILRVESEHNVFAVNSLLVSVDIRYPDYLNGTMMTIISNLWDCINMPALERLTFY